jgi:hypothetical protein
MSLLKKILISAIFTIVIVFIIYNYFIYVDVENSCFITIIPSTELSNINIKRSLSALKLTAYDEYRNICKHISTISANVGCGGFEGGCFYSDQPKTAYVSTDMNNLAWTMGVLVHEACHAQQYKEKRSISEMECHQRDDVLLNDIVEY